MNSMKKANKVERLPLLNKVIGLFAFNIRKIFTIFLQQRRVQSVTNLVANKTARVCILKQDL